MDELWECDLINLLNLSKANDRIQYIWLAIDVLSKYVWLIPLINKTVAVRASALKMNLKKGWQPSNLRAVIWVEFINANMFAKYDINYYSTYNSTNPNLAEKCLRTIKHKISRYLTENETDIYINKLLEFSYNETPHSSIGLAPIEVNTENKYLISWVLLN